MSAGIFIVVAGLAAIVGTLTWWSVAAWREGRRRAARAAAAQAAREEARRNFKRQMYPAIKTVPAHACGNASPIPLKLEMTESLASDISALMSTEVILDGECVHSAWSPWLLNRTGRTFERLCDVEAVASRHPHQEWLVKFIEPLQSLVYQRHPDGNWNLVRVGSGMF